MDTNSPAYWRQYRRYGLIPMIVGIVLWSVGLTSIRHHPYQSPSPAPICEPSPCDPAMMAATGQQNPQPQEDNSGPAMAIFGFLLMIGGSIPGTIAAQNLRRIENAALDYQYQQMQSQGRTVPDIPAFRMATLARQQPAPIAEPTVASNDEPYDGAFCTKCGHQSKPGDEFCSKCGAKL